MDEPSVTRPSQAEILAAAELVCPSLNGPASFRLAAGLETIDAGLPLDGLDGFDEIADALANPDERRVEHWARALDLLDARLITVLDDEYPANLRMIHDHPPFLFARGTLDPVDDRAVAIVGTRDASDQGRRAAHDLAGSLAESGVTVVSGLAAGIDTAAHAGALAAGGRTIAVYGTGIARVYPAANRALADGIIRSGASVSQFWPDTPPARWTFPVRNIVTSGLSLGTVVVEAGPTSGARQQAEHALRHGKQLFLLRHLVNGQDWARDLAGQPGVRAIDDPAELLPLIELELDLQADILL